MGGGDTFQVVATRRGGAEAFFKTRPTWVEIFLAVHLPTEAPALAF